MNRIHTAAATAGGPVMAAPAAARGRPTGALGAWWAQGTRSALLMRPRWAGLTATPAVVAGLYLLPLALQVLAERLYIVGPARFYAPALLADGGLGLGLTLLCCWLLVRQPARGGPAPRDAASLFALACAQALPVSVVLMLVFVPMARSGDFATDAPLNELARDVWIAAATWALGARALLLWRASSMPRRPRAAVIAVAVGVALAQQLFMPLRHWYPERPEPPEDSAPPFHLTQELVESQSQALQDDLHALAPQRRGVVDVYALTFAPDADAEVFRRESALVAGVMETRFDAHGRTLQLASHRDDAPRPAWATAVNLQRAIRRMAAVMNRDEDILFIHLTSHGARNGELAPSFWPLHVDPLTPAQLKAWLDDAGVRWRVLSVSACYSGGWLAPLAGDGTLIMTAADADHTSYGCGRRSALTFFGRAMFDEQLRTTWSFEQAHAAARSVIARREKEAGKDDGYSNPQISVGAGIAQRLRVLEAQRAAAAR